MKSFLLYNLDRLIRNKLTRWPAQLLLVSAPVVLGLAQLQETFQGVWLLERSKAYFATHPKLIVLAAVSTILLLAFNEVGRYARSYVRSLGELNEEGFSTLLNAIDCIVGEKSRGFSACLREMTKDGSLTAEEVFMRVAQPEEQYKVIVNAIHSFFSELYYDTRVKFRVVLVKMGTTFAEEIVWYAPPSSPPGVEVADLQFEDVCYSRCKNGSSIIIVPDIKRESAKDAKVRLCRSLGAKKDYGSLICYPIWIDGKDIRMVLSIHALKKGVFSNRKVDVVKWETVLERFEKRLNQEYTLQLIRERTEQVVTGERQ